MTVTRAELDAVARVLVEHSTKVQPGERVMIAMTELHAYPLTLALHHACTRAGAHVQVQLLSAELKDSVLRLGSPDQVGWVPEIETYGMDWADVYFGLRGASNLHTHDGVPDQVLADHQRALGTVSAKRWAETRWCLVRIPDEAMAATARTSLDRLYAMFVKGCTLDWASLGERWRRTADLLSAARDISLIGPDTKLSFSTRGRRWVVFDGEKNLPDGEIATAPVVESVNGTIAFSYPGVFAGRIVEGIRLTWRDGELVDATARTNQQFLEQVIATDAGASALGEFGIGVNPAIDRFSYDILYDEKMTGTVHAALGRAYPECGGTNQSSLHWDIIHDMSAGGGSTLYADGRPVTLPV